MADNLDQQSDDVKQALLESLMAEWMDEEVVEETAVSIPTINRQQALPLSFAQQRLWFIDQLEADSAAYNVTGAVRLQGNLNIDWLAQAIEKIVARHESLRTTFSSINGLATQVIHSQMPVPLAQIDLRHYDDPEAEISRIATQEAREPFDLSNGPLLRLMLLRLEATSHILLINMHHAVSDGWSVGLLIQEFATFYEALSQNTEPPLADLSIQYADFAHWQRKWLEAKEQTYLADYWHKQLAYAPDFLALPTDFPRPPIRSSRGAKLPFSLSTDLTEKLNAFALQQDVTLFMVLLAAYNILLYRYTGQTDLLVGSPIANRTRTEIESLIGVFINTLVLRTQLEDDPTVDALLQRTKQMTLDAYAHQEMPFEWLVDQLNLTRNLSYTPLFQTIFVLQNAPMPPMQVGEIKLEVMPVETHTAKVDLTLTLEEANGALVGNWEYSTDLFKPETIQQMMRHFTNLLTAIVADPTQAVSRLPMLTADERHTLLTQWNDTAQDYGSPLTLHGMFEAQADKTPKQIALRFADETLTYAELDQRANQLAHHLQAMNVQPDQLVGICMERSIEMVVGMMAILKAGGAYVPLDPTYPPERLAFMVEDAETAVLLTHTPCLAYLPESEARVVCVDSDWSIIAQQPTTRPTANLTPDHLAYMIYTSGSTGKPKGAMNPHRAIFNRLMWMQSAYQLTTADTVMQKTPFSFDVSVWEFFWTLGTGATLAIAKPEGHKDTDYLAQLIQDAQVTTMHFVPSMLQIFVELADISLCGSLRQVICSGEALPPELQARFFQKLSAELHNLYGPTEAAIDVSYWNCQESQGWSWVPIGRPIDNIQLYILDDHLEPVPFGVTGELHIGGVGVARGYHNRPTLTAEKFIDDPFTPNGRLYKTGDLARYRQGGIIDFLGRKDFQVKIRGFRIELGEIEYALSQHEQVREAVVMGLARGDGEKQLVAYLVTPNKQPIPSTELRQHLLQTLPDYMVPAQYVFLETFPLTANGKTNRKALPAPDSHRPELETAYTAPTTPEEKILAEIWQEVLDVERVGIHDNYFALGGDSIRSIRVASLAKNQGMTFPLQAMFQYQTIAELVANLGNVGDVETLAEKTEPFDLINDEDRAKLPAGVVDAYPMTSIQLGMIYHIEFDPDSTAYRNVTSFYLRALFDLENMKKAFQYVVDQHPILRTAFDMTTYSEPMQLVYEQVTLNIGFTDISELSYDEQDQILDDYIEKETVTHFDLATPPGLRVHIHLRGDGRYQLTITDNHAILDGWSYTSMLAQIFAKFFQLRGDDSFALPPDPPSTYRDYVALQRQTLQRESHRKYWYEKLQGANFTKLPRLHTRKKPSNPERFDINREILLVQGEKLERLKALAKTQGCTLKSLCLATHMRVLSFLGNTDDVVTGLATNGRLEEMGSELVIGLFLNTVPFRVKLADESWGALIKQIFDAEVELLPYRRYPLALLQRDWGKEPILETLFNYVHFHSLGELVDSGLWEILHVKETADTNFALVASFQLSPSADELRIFLDYDLTQLDRDQILSIRQYYGNVLTAMTTQPQANHFGSNLLTEAERMRLETDQQTSQRDYALNNTLAERWAQVVAEKGEATAVFQQQTPISYKQLDTQANQLAHYLQAQGANDLVALCLPDPYQMLLGQLATLKLGVPCLPLLADDPTAYLNKLLATAKPALTLAARPLGTGQQTAWPTALDAYPTTPPASSAQADQTAFYFARLDANNQPFIRAHSHEMVLNQVAWLQETRPLTEKDHLLQSGNWQTAVSLLETFWPLLHGVPLTLTDPAQDDIYLLQLVQEGVTVFFSAPSQLATLLEYLDGSEETALKTIFCIGEEIAEALVTTFHEHFDASLYYLYAPSEIDPILTGLLCDHDFASLYHPIGNVIANTEIEVRTPHNQQLPMGVFGQMVARWSFAPNWVETGQLGRFMRNGRLETPPTNHTEARVNLFHVPFLAIEQTMQEHEAIKEAVIISRANDLNPHLKQLMAYIILADGQSVTSEILQTYLQAHLPRHMVPQFITTVESFPRLPNGNINREALVELDYKPSAILKDTPYVAPQNEFERAITTVWQGILHVERVGIHDNILDLGGHSLLMVRIQKKLQEALEQRISILDMFKYPTPHTLAQHLANPNQEQENIREEAQDRAETRLTAMRQRQQRRRQRR